MVDFVTLEDTKPKGLTNKQRTLLIISTYILNFVAFVLLFDIYENFILKWMTFILILSFSFQMLAQKINIGGINSWMIVYTIINAFAFGITSMMFSYHLLVLGLNFLYFKYIVQKVK